MAAAAKISVTMTPDMAEAVRKSVEAGDYASESDALRDAVRVWRREREERGARIDAIKARLGRSIEDPRPALTADEVRRRLGELHAETVRAHGREAP